MESELRRICKARLHYKNFFDIHTIAEAQRIDAAARNEKNNAAPKVGLKHILFRDEDPWREHQRQAEKRNHLKIFPAKAVR